MDLELDDEQVALVESVRQVLDREWPPTAMRRLAERGEGGDQLWDRMVALDWPALCVPEADGGMGYGAVEAALVLEACGAAVVGGPLLPTLACFAPVVRRVGSPQQRSQLLGAVASGRETGTAALTEVTGSRDGADADLAALPVTARRVDRGWRLDGEARAVVEAGAVDHVVVPAAVDGGAGLGLFVVPSHADGIRVDAVRTPDTTRCLGHLHLAGVEVGDDAALGEPGAPTVPAALRAAADEATTLLAAELVGTCDAILRRTLDHVKSREQFGVVIGSFQALKHRLADAYLAVEAARASVLVAAVAVDEDDPRRTVAASSAKALAGDCADLLATEGIQMHGGIGFTWEHDMHLYVKRAKASAALLGTAEAHRQRVAALIGLVPAR